MRQGLDLTVHRYGRRHRMRRQAAAAALALACAALAAGLVLRFGPAAVAWLAALPARAETAVGDWLMPRYADRLAELQRQNADLHARLADTAGLQAENEALRREAAALREQLDRLRRHQEKEKEKPAQDAANG